MAELEGSDAVPDENKSQLVSYIRCEVFSALTNITYIIYYISICFRFLRGFLSSF